MVFFSTDLQALTQEEDSEHGKRERGLECQPASRWREWREITGLALHGRFVLFHQLVENTVRNLDQFRIDLAVRRDCIGQGDRCDLVAAQCSHLAPLAAVHHVDGAQPVTRGQHPVEGTGGAPALNVAQDDGPGLKARSFFDFLRQRVPDAAQLLVSELILAEVAYHQSGLARGRELGALRGDHDAEVTSTRMPLTYQL